MRWTTTAVLAVLLVGLGAFFYVYDVKQAPEREKALTEKDRVYKGLEAKDIEDLSLTRKGETIQLKRSGESWNLAAPVQGRAESQAVQPMLGSLASLRIEREIEASPAKPADFGLDKPAAEIDFAAKGAKHRLRLGAKTPTGLWVYAQLDDKPAVVLVSDSLLRDAEKPLDDFRDKTLLAFEAKDVKAIEVKTPGGQSVTAQRQGGDDWQVGGSPAVKADREQVTGLLDKLRTAKIKEFVTGTPPKGADPYGLERPLALTLWVGEEKERAAKALRLGKPLPEKKSVYAQREGDPTVFTVDEQLVKAIPTSPTAMRDKTVFAYDRGKLERVALESPKGKVALAMDGGAWKITAPTAMKADEGGVSDLLWKARDLRAKAFAAEDSRALARFGLDRPQVRLSVWEKDAKAPKSLLLAPAKEKDMAYATASDGGPVVLVEAKALDELARSAQELRDRSLFSGFDTRDVARLSIGRKDQTIVLEKKGEEAWQLVAPRTGKANAGRVNELLWTLRNLKWRELVAEQGWEPAKYELDPPATTITLAGKDGQRLGALAIGSREKGDAYVRVPDQPALYLVESKSLGDIPAAPDELLQ